MLLNYPCRHSSTFRSPSNHKIKCTLPKSSQSPFSSVVERPIALRTPKAILRREDKRSISFRGDSSFFLIYFPFKLEFIKLLAETKTVFF